MLLDGKPIEPCRILTENLLPVFVLDVFEYSFYDFSRMGKRSFVVRVVVTPQQTLRSRYLPVV